MVKRIWINATLAHDLVRFRANRTGVNGEFQVIADGLRLQAPCQHASGKQADGKEGDHARRQRVIAACFDLRSCSRRFAGEIDFRRAFRAIEKVFIGFEPAARQVGDARKDQRCQGGCGHDHAGNFKVETIGTNQKQPDQRCIHSVMPDERRDDAPAQHHNSRNNSDDSYFDSANVGRFLRVIAVQKTPKKSGHDYRHPARARQSHEKRDGEQPEGELLVHGSKQPDGDAGNPGDRRIHAVRIVQLLGRPRPQTGCDHVEGDDKTNVCGGQAQTHSGRREKLLRTQPAQREDFPQA